MQISCVRGFFLTILGLCLVFLATHSALAETGHAHWSYLGKTAPEHWGKLSGEYKLCAEGKMQSPIDIKNSQSAKLPSLDIVYKKSKGTLVNNGHSLQVNLEGDSYITIDGKKYSLLQFHFHSPSEHHINGEPADFVIHFVHRAKDGKLAVIGYLMQVGDKHGLIAQLWENAPTNPGQSQAYKELALDDFFTSHPKYYSYSGSLTTPPCSEGVHWIVLQNPGQLSLEQIKQFASLFPKSVRPVQPLYGRVVKKSK